MSRSVVRLTKRWLAIGIVLTFIIVSFSCVKSSTPNKPLATLIDDFSDGDYINNPIWTVYLVTWQASNFYLESTDAGSQKISTPYTQATGGWEFRFKLESADGLYSDRLAFFFMSSAADPTSTNGYYLRIDSYDSANGGPVFYLTRRDGMGYTHILTSTWTPDTNWHTAKITRTAAGYMEIYLDTVLKGSVTDATYTTTSYIAAWCSETAGDLNHNCMIDDIYYYPPVNPPSVTLTSPNGGENWLQGSSQTITWNPATQGDYPLKANPITLYYSTTGPGGPWTQIVANLPNTGSYSPWVIPSVSTTNAYVRIMAEDNQIPSNPGYDISNGAFTMYAVPPSVTLTAPNGGEVWIQGSSQTITWTPATQGTWPLKANPITLSYSTTGPAGPWTQIAANLANTGSYSPWIVPSVSTTNAYVKIDAADDRSPANIGSDVSNAAFTISSGNPPTVTVNAPNGGEKWFIQGAYDITFTVTAGTFPLAPNPITIYYSVTGPTGPWTQIAANLPNVSPYNWSIPASVPQSINAYIKVEAKDDRPTPNAGSDIGNAAFTLSPAALPAVTVTAPNGGEIWAIGQQKDITWTATKGTFPLAASPMTIYYSTSGATGPYTLIATNELNDGTYKWTVPGTVSANSYVKVEAKDDRPTPNLANDTSNAAFNITTAIPPTVVVTYPNGGESFSVYTTIQVQWVATNGTNPLSSKPITLWYSLNGTGGPWTQIDTNVSNTGTYQWILPGTPSNDSYVRVKAIDTANYTGTDISDGPFKILAGNAPPYLNMVSPLGGEMLNGRRDVVWQGADANKNTVTYNVNISSDGGSTWNLINTSTYAENATVVQHSFSLDTTKYADGTSYRIEIDANDHNGSVVIKETQNFTIDNIAPVSSVLPLTPYAKSVSFTVKWNGSDSASGIDHFDIYYSVDQGAFAKWVTTTNVSGTFTGQEGHRYGFYSIAFDKAGNNEAKSIEEAWTRIDATSPKTNAVPLPKYVNSTTFDVAYNVTDASPTNVTLYYKKELGSWAKYGNFSKSPISFQSSGEASYEFYTEGMDAAGNKEPKGAAMESCTIVDTTPPSTQLQAGRPGGRNVTVKYDAKDNYEIQFLKILYSHSDDNTTWDAWQVGLALPGGGAKSISSSKTMTFKDDGYYRLKPGTTDGANNTDPGTSMVYFRIDTVPPEVISWTPADGAKNVPLSPEVDIVFSEPMDRASVEKSINVPNYTGKPEYSWDSTSTKITFDLLNLMDNATYTISALPTAKDLAGNRLKRSDISFTTIPTRGGILGRVISSENIYLKGAKVVLKAENGTRMSETSTDLNGFFRFDSLLAGNYTVASSASGHEPSEAKVAVVAGQSVSIMLTLQKNNIGLYLAVGAGMGILLFFLLLFFLLVIKKRRKCPQCGTRVKKNVEICPKCKARIPLYQIAAKPKKSLLSTKKGKEKGADATGTEELPVTLPMADIYAAPKVPTKCPSCKDDVPAGEEWCPNCGAMVALPVGAQTCPKCGGTMGGDGVCMACGFSEMATPALLPEMDMHEPGKECPRCYAPLEPESKFCAICGGDIEKLAKKQKQKEERITTMKEDAKPGAKIDVGKAKAPPPLGAAPSKIEPAIPHVPSPKVPEPPKVTPVHAQPKTEPAKAPPTAMIPSAWPVREQPPIPTPPKAESAKPELPKAPPIPQPKPMMMPGPSRRTPPKPVTSTQIKENICEKCKKPLKFIEKYDRWYCNDCKQYAAKEKSIHAEAPVPSEKRTQLTMDEATVIAQAEARPPIPKPTQMMTSPDSMSMPTVIAHPETRPPQSHVPKPGPATPPPAVAHIHTMPASSGKSCKTCNSPIPAGAKWCDVCGEKA